MKKPVKDANMTVRGTKQFRKVLNTLAAMLNISRDEVIERAVRGFYKEKVDFIEAQIEEEEVSAPAA
jgi:hypothetical protein